MKQAEENNLKLILVIGRKLPRWPECHTPIWFKNLSKYNQQHAILKLIKKIVSRYEKYKSVVAWQIENEPFLKFGKCPLFDAEFLKREINLVRELSSKKIIITASGELNSWYTEVNMNPDIIGISLYRTVLTPYNWYWYYPFSPFFYLDRINFYKKFFGKNFVISELQAEPWIKGNIIETPLLKQYKIMNEYFLAEILNFTSYLGVKNVYLWGIEWWYWLKKNGDLKFWNTAKSLIKEYSL